ncbi:MAG: TIGR00282 family metallophosphoesterase [Clostridiales bacterium]|jgi:metallophosphoesterase (TIGR00282 family)|nr:TIGR00282 family metallophosphoesterase [Clostridiales bacterium]
MLIFTVGDVVGKAARDFLIERLPVYKKFKGIDLCIVNGENSAQGNGISPSSCEQLFLAGADVVTTGNHVYKRNEVYEYLDSQKPVIRPANYNENNPGKGYVIADKGRYQCGVINIMGTAFLECVENPFCCMDRILPKLSDCKIIIVDFHAEATSEKRAMGFYLDGKVTAVVGTHTHVQTADEQILRSGTAYITDLGMTGPLQSVLGIKPELVINKLKYQMPTRFENAVGDMILCGCLIEADEKTGKALSIERVVIS